MLRFRFFLYFASPLIAAIEDTSVRSVLVNVDDSLHGSFCTPLPHYPSYSFDLPPGHQEECVFLWR